MPAHGGFVRIKCIMKVNQLQGPRTASSPRTSATTIVTRLLVSPQSRASTEVCMPVVHLGGEPRQCCRGGGKRLEGREPLFAMLMSSCHCAAMCPIPLGTSGPLHGTCLEDVPLEGEEAKIVTCSPRRHWMLLGPLAPGDQACAVCPGQGKA